MNKSQEIQSIIAQRQPLAQKLADIETGLSSLYASLRRLEQERDRSINIIFSPSLNFPNFSQVQSIYSYSNESI